MINCIDTFLKVDSGKILNSIALTVTLTPGLSRSYVLNSELYKLCRGKYSVLGWLPGLHFADVLHVLKLSQLGQCVMTQCLVEGRVSVLVLNIKFSLSSHKQLQEKTQEQRDA